jgi:hypothetical protein
MRPYMRPYMRLCRRQREWRRRGRGRCCPMMTSADELWVSIRSMRTHI